MKKYFEDVIMDYENGFINVFEFTDKCNHIIFKLAMDLNVSDALDSHEKHKEFVRFLDDFKERCRTLILRMMEDEDEE